MRCSGFVPIGAWLTDVPRLLEGEAGAGKTAALGTIAGELARAALAASVAVPVVIPASALAMAGTVDPEARFVEALATASRVPAASWRELLDRREAVVLVDELDQVSGGASGGVSGDVPTGVSGGGPGGGVSGGGAGGNVSGADVSGDPGGDVSGGVPGDNRARVLAALTAALAAWPGLRCVIASRPCATDDVRALGFRRTAIEPLDEEAAAAWVASTSARAAAAIAASPALVALCRTPRAAVRLADRLGALDLPAPAAIALVIAAAHAGDPDAEAQRLLGLLALLRLSDASLERTSARWAGEPLLPLALGVLAGDAPARARRWFDAILDRATEAAGADRAGRAGGSSGPSGPSGPSWPSWIDLAARAWLAVRDVAVPAQRERYRHLLATMLELAATAAPNDGIAALEALGREGDPRIGATPRLAVVPGQPDVAVGVFPVTVAEFRAFVEGGGYREPRWWGAGWAARVEAGWTAPGRWTSQLRAPNRPVVNVSWYEARAYAAWVADVTGRPLGLVTSEAWQLAATHPDGPYPWGAAEPASDRLNFDQHVGRATPVGLYPRGASPGAGANTGGAAGAGSDGNVWEWCHDRAGPTTRVVRGAGWYSAGKYARADYHYGFDPTNRFHDLGLRLGAGPGTASEDD